MKFSKKLTMAAVATLALVGTAACSKSGNSSSSSSEKIPSKITKKTTVVFWNAMPGVQGSTLKQLTNEFEKKNPKITVKLENQGAYNDLQAKINSTLQSPNNLPTITQAYPGWLWNAAQNKMLVNHISTTRMLVGAVQRHLTLELNFLMVQKLRELNTVSHLTSQLKL